MCPSAPTLRRSGNSCGTICHSTSRLQNLCLSSAVASRLISLGAAFRDTLTVVVPEKWLCHSGHVNRFCYLLTYLLTYYSRSFADNLRRLDVSMVLTVCCAEERHCAVYGSSTPCEIVCHSAYVSLSTFNAMSFHCRRCQCKDVYVAFQTVLTMMILSVVFFRLWIIITVINFTW